MEGENERERERATKSARLIELPWHEGHVTIVAAENGTGLAEFKSRTIVSLGKLPVELMESIKSGWIEWR